MVNFVRQGKPKKAQQAGEPSQRELELSAGIIDLDPFNKQDKARVQEILKEEDDREFYEAKDMVAGVSEEDWERLKQERATRVEMDRHKEMLEKKIQTLQEYINFLEEEYGQLEESHGQQIVGQKKSADRINKIRFNFECMVYVKQGQVEVPPLPVANDYKDAILVQKKVIDDENAQVCHKGDAKVLLLEEIAEFRTKMRRVQFTEKRLQLEIDDYEQRALDVQMYRVTKQTQEILQGKHQKKDEDDKKRLENQMKSITANTDDRVRTIMKTRAKKQREIDEKAAESEELEAKARVLQSAVEQR